MPNDDGEDHSYDKFVTIWLFRWTVGGLVATLIGLGTTSISYVISNASRIAILETEQQTQKANIAGIQASQSTLSQNISPELKALGERLTNMNEGMLKQRLADQEAALREMREREQRDRVSAQKGRGG